jgi:hypothetical protein
MMHYTVYKVTNLLNGKYYIGAHKTEDLNDGYYGSGVAVKQAIDKHGRDNFQKEILFIYNNADDMWLKEQQLVTEQVVKDRRSYNMCTGGGTYPTEETKVDYETLRKNGLKGSQKQWEFYRNNPEILEEVKAKASASLKVTFARKGGTWTGRSHSEETKELMRKVHAANGHMQGKKNSQYGTCWIYHPELKENKRIVKEQIPEYITNGWIKGRKMTF